MDDTELPSRQQRPPDHSSTLPAQPWKPPIHLPSSDPIPSHGLIDAGTEQIQRIPPDTAIRQQWQLPTHLSSLERASLPIDMNTEETWHLPAIQWPVRRRSIFKVIWMWLKKTGT